MVLIYWCCGQFQLKSVSFHKTKHYSSELKFRLQNQNTKMIFKVHEVKKGQDSFETENGFDLISKYSKKIAASSIDNKNYVKTSEYAVEVNQFLFMLFEGYNNHKPITISPDILWLLVCQGFAEHVKKNSWYLKFRLVKFLLGKKTIIVDMDNKEDWNEVISDVCNKISDYTKGNIKSKLVLEFSTSTSKEKTAFEIAFMDSVSKFFSYEGISICGFPEIELKGSIKDYEKIISSLNFIEKYGLKWWTKPLKKIIREIINTLNGEINNEFWQKIFIYEPYNMSGGKDKVTGWITHFFPYIKKPNHRSTKTRLIKNPYIFNSHKLILNLDNFPSGLSKVPFKWIKPDRVENYNIFSGFIGITEDSNTGFLKSEINWLIEKKNS